jgi:hypothetical protein
MDELKVLEEIFTKKLDFFHRLRMDWESFEQIDSSAGNSPNNQEQETPFERIAFAEHMMEESSKQCQRLNADLRESLNSVRNPV